MALLSDGERYGGLVKALHWFVVALFVLQYVGGWTMTRLPPGGGAYGMSGDSLYNWHKSVGLVALAVAVVRLWARRAGVLPPWAPTLSDLERKLVHRYEQALYAAMFVMPVSGFVFVMAGATVCCCSANGRCRTRSGNGRRSLPQRDGRMSERLSSSPRPSSCTPAWSCGTSSCSRTVCCGACCENAKAPPSPTGLVDAERWATRPADHSQTRTRRITTVS